MVIQIYAKLNEQLSIFDDLLAIIKEPEDEVFITTENKRSFRLLENIRTTDTNTIVAISSVSSLGLNDADIANELSWFKDNSAKLVICDIPSTYEYGITQPMNQAVLGTILQSILSGNKNVITVTFKRSNSGRSKLPFPDNWDELYEKWDRGELSSKQFIEMSGLKKATFYNLMTEYKEIQSANANFLKKYKVV